MSDEEPLTGGTLEGSADTPGRVEDSARADADNAAESTDSADDSGPAGDTPMIVLRDVHKVYRLRDGSQVHALDGLTLDVPAGSIHGVVGTSGAGKSTLVRCLTALEQPTSGEVRVAGQDLTSLSARGLREARRAIGMVFQHANLLDSRTTAQNIAYPLALAGVKAGGRHETVERMLQLVGLADRGSSYPAQLSGGQKQRVGIARALMQRPEILLADEPTSSLDPKTSVEIMELLKSQGIDNQIPVLVNIHDVNLARRYADRIVGMTGGKVVFDGPPADLTDADLNTIYGGKDWLQ